MLHRKYGNHEQERKYVARAYDSLYSITLLSKIPYSLVSFLLSLYTPHSPLCCPFVLISGAIFHISFLLHHLIDLNRGQL